MAEINIDSIIELNITDIGTDGKAIGKTNEGLVIFTENAVPGDIIKARIKKIKKNFAEAFCEDIIHKSEFRAKPECEYFGTCNGCKMQNIIYSEQLEIKFRSVKNSFERIGGFKDIEVPPVTGSDNIYFYRNKLEFSFSSNKWLTKDDINKDNIDKTFALGFHIPKFIDKVLDIHNCYLQSDLSAKILNFTRDFFKSRNESIYSTKTHSGYLRFLVIRNSPITKELLVNLITSEEKPELINEFGKVLKKEIPGINTLVNTISTLKAQVSTGEYSNIIFGKGYIYDRIGEYSFKITPNTFFQTNTLQADKLFNKLAQIADLRKSDSVLDLYCGCGAISLYISKYVNIVLGVEQNSESIKSAVENAVDNNVRNTQFTIFDVKDFLKHLVFEGLKEFNTIILDPPRSGIHPKAANYLLEYEAPKIIYVSCNPATQARDIKLLSEKYYITNMQPVDMFPHTFHIENICRLDLK